MKRNHLLCIILLLLPVSFVYSQSNNNAIYEVLIFKWSKKGNSIDEKIIRIDSLGKVFLNDENINQKINIKTFTKGINDFVKKEKPEKVPANDDPPREVPVPGNNEQIIHIAVTYLKDYYTDKDFPNKTQYYWVSPHLPVNDDNYTLLKYLDKDDLSALRRLLE